MTSLEVQPSADAPGQPAIEVRLARASSQVPAQIEGIRTRVVRNFSWSGSNDSFSERMQAAIPAKERHWQELMNATGIYAVGVGRSQDDPNDAAIVIYGEASALARVPTFIDGVRTRLIEGDRYTTTWGKHEMKVNVCPKPAQKK